MSPSPNTSSLPPNASPPSPAPSSSLSPPPDDSAPESRKRKAQDEECEDGPLLSEYMCPICFSPPKSALITPCGHILCGPCLHGAISARPPASQPQCPVCRTPIPNLRFTIPEPAPIPDPQPRPQHVPPPSRSLPGGFRLPTHGQDMVDPFVPAPEHYIDVDADQPITDRWDPSRSGVVGLEILTMHRL
ncbi:hypothetical protein CTheo_7129 [Ceratobasidium theobromae]|uniref:RING-type domain-containing protein n=1 Tax=Ceratobasidium theobromae TaxID=1582974 RepID=A0A5N5QCF8_9AGAM|nr:hypothetical protein CTheo_7129 [Ceratobasidium theobromae]